MHEAALARLREQRLDAVDEHLLQRGAVGQRQIDLELHRLLDRGAVAELPVERDQEHQVGDLRGRRQQPQQLLRTVAGQAVGVVDQHHDAGVAGGECRCQLRPRRRQLARVRRWLGVGGQRGGGQQVHEPLLHVLTAGQQPRVPVDDRPLRGSRVVAQRRPRQVERGGAAAPGLSVEADRNARLGRERGDDVGQVCGKSGVPQRIGRRVVQRPIGGQLRSVCGRFDWRPRDQVFQPLSSARGCPVLTEIGAESNNLGKPPAGVAELVDAPALGAGGSGRGGSSPLARIPGDPRPGVKQTMPAGSACPTPRLRDQRGSTVVCCFRTACRRWGDSPSARRIVGAICVVSTDALTLARP
jgi:hypothetical protein